MPKQNRYRVKKKSNCPRICISCYKNMATYLRGTMAFCGDCLLNYAVIEGKIDKRTAYSLKGKEAHMNGNNMLKHLVNTGYIKELRDE